MDETRNEPVFFVDIRAISFVFVNFLGSNYIPLFYSFAPLLLRSCRCHLYRTYTLYWLYSMRLYQHDHIKHCQSQGDSKLYAENILFGRAPFLVGNLWGRLAQRAWVNLVVESFSTHGIIDEIIELQFWITLHTYKIPAELWSYTDFKAHTPYLSLTLYLSTYWLFIALLYVRTR